MSSTLASADASAVRPVIATRTVATGAVLLAAACVLGLVEAALPPLPVAPWLRLGLANIAVVVALAIVGGRTAAVVSIGRTIIVALATGSLFSPAFAMSFGGAMLSLLAMIAVRELLSGSSPVGWSAVGSVAHVAGQFSVAALTVGSMSILALAPASALVALVFGVIVGSLARLAVSRVCER